MHELFSIPVYQNKINIDCKKLETLAYEEQKKDTIGRCKSNNGYQTNDLDFNIYKFLFDEVSKHAEEFFKCFNHKVDLKYLNAWINISGNKDFNRLHNHQQSIISGVVYIRVPDNSGNIIFENPNLAIEYVHPTEELTSLNNYNSPEWFIKSIAGEILMFPSYLRHYVQENKSNKDRISLSFNLGKNHNYR